MLQAPAVVLRQTGAGCTLLWGLPWLLQLAADLDLSVTERLWQQPGPGPDPGGEVTPGAGETAGGEQHWVQAVVYCLHLLSLHLRLLQ